jgi:hypothetical protein
MPAYARVEVHSGGAGGWAYTVEKPPTSSTVTILSISDGEDRQAELRLDQSLLTSLLQTLPLFVHRA